MRVGVDGTSWTNRRGYGRFVRNALTRLVELDGDARYVFYVGEETELPERAEARPLRRVRDRRGRSATSCG